MIRVKASAELPAGVHGAAIEEGHRITVLLLPRLSRRNRQAVLRRLYREGLRGLGPALPPPVLYPAVGAYLVRRACRDVVAAARVHPRSAAVVVAAVFAVLVVVRPVGIRVVHLQAVPGGTAAGGAPGAWAAPPATPTPVPGPVVPSRRSGSSAPTVPVAFVSPTVGVRWTRFPRPPRSLSPAGGVTASPVASPVSSPVVAPTSPVPTAASPPGGSSSPVKAVCIRVVLLSAGVPV